MKCQIGLAIVSGFMLIPAVLAQGQSGSNIITKSTKAVGYTIGKTTKVDLVSTSLLPQASGEASVKAKSGITEIKVAVNGLAQPGKLGTEFLTYVLWVVSPDGATSNIGEIAPDKNGRAQLQTSTRLQTFSLIVTAEPYFAVRRPSELIVLENDTRKNTKAKIFPVQEYRLMQVAQYKKLGNPLALTMDMKTVPLEMYEARNAIDIAKSREAEKYAPEIYTKAEGSLKLAENTLARKANKREIISAARQTVQFAEDARALATERMEAERIAKEREAAAAKARAEAEAKAEAEAAEAKRKADAEAAAAKRRADEDAARAAELAAAREARLKAEADAAAAKAKGEADLLKAKEEAAKAEAERARLAAEQLRAQLLEQFNRILETRETTRGLVVNIGDVLFDTGKFNLRQEAREKLARFAGIVLGHPGLYLQIEGHTDSTGSDELNQRLSEQRAGEVRAYLIGQGLNQDRITSQGFGKSMPVADNTSAAGRQKNRRVEIVVSGDVIGIPIGR